MPVPGRIDLALLLLAGLASVGFLCGCGGSIQAAEPAWEDAQAEAERGGYRLITTDEMWGLLQEDSNDLLLIDTRQGWEFRSGHIAGAAHLSMEPTVWARWKARRPLRKLLGEDRERLLVFY